jgi:hypothetical protein
LLIKQIFSKQFDIKYQLYGTLCIFFAYFITFRKYFRYLFHQKVNNEKKLGIKGSFKNRKANTPFITINNMFAFIILLK